MPENERITHKARILIEIVAEYYAIAGSSTIHLALMKFLSSCVEAQHEPFGRGCYMLAPWVEGGFPLLPASVGLLPGTSNGCGFQSGALGYAPRGAEP